MAIPLGPPSPAGSCGQPGSLGREKPWGALRPPARSLFGLAPGGACHAADVAAGAVGSYPTVSPLPSGPEAGGRSDLCGAFPRVAPGGRYPPPSLPGVRTFLDLAAAAIRPSARACLGARAASVKRKRSAPRVLRLGRRRPRPRPEPQPRRREHLLPVAPGRHSPPRRRPRRTPPTRGAPRPSGPTARPPRASRRQSNFGPGSALRPGAMSEWAMTPAAGMRQRAMIAVEERLERRHLRLRERREGRERPGVGELDADRARVDVALPPPAAGARVPGALAPRRPAARPGRPRRRDSAPRPRPPDRKAARAPPRPSPSPCGAARRAPGAGRRGARRSWGSAPPRLSSRPLAPRSSPMRPSPAPEPLRPRRQPARRRRARDADGQPRRPPAPPRRHPRRRPLAEPRVDLLPSSTSADATATVMGRGYTELFFLDEATALAAGHRPCFECRRADARAFAALWPRAGGPAPPRSRDGPRAPRRAARARATSSPAATLPAGAIFAAGGRLLPPRRQRRSPGASRAIGRRGAFDPGEPVTAVTPADDPRRSSPPATVLPSTRARARPSAARDRAPGPTCRRSRRRRDRGRSGRPRGPPPDRKARCAASASRKRPQLPTLGDPGADVAGIDRLADGVGRSAWRRARC